MMKKTIAIILIAVCVPLASHADFNSVDNLIVGSLIEQINALITQLNAIVDANNKVESTAISGLTQSDTNATTSVTTYTPAFVGQVLVGSAGSGTNAAWIAAGTTTNDWNQILP